MTKACDHCGKQFESLYPDKLYCSRACKAAAYRKKQNDKRNIKSYRPPVEKWSSSPRKQIETDADQARIKREVDERYGIGHQPGRRIEKGSDEWKQIEMELIPLDRIRNGTSHYGHLYGAYHQGRR
jgi:hypothetical protein